jgi:hypothetical protein
MFKSKEYWENRYKIGQTSGNGSYGFLAEYKSGFINNYISENNITSLLEYGCGDGNQLSYINCQKIIGVDVSQTAIDKCKSLITDGEFICLSNSEFPNNKTDLLLSLDVIYHLIEDDVYEEYINNIINHGSEHVIIYSVNFDGGEEFAKHVKPRKFTEHPMLTKKYELTDMIKNKYPSMNHNKGSFSDWFIFRKKN